MFRQIVAISIISLGLTIPTTGQDRKTNASLKGESAQALSFFARIKEQNFDDYLKRVRLPKVSQTFKAQVLMQITKGEMVRVSSKMKEKLALLAPILTYHERDSVIEIRVIDARELFISLQGRSVLLIAEKALNLLLVEELQAVVAHELGHEYFWGELLEARQQKKRDVAREIELRCDGIAVITLRRLGLNPAKLDSALTKIKMFNTQTVSTDTLYHPTPDERSRFIRAMDELVKSKNASPTFALIRSGQ